MNAQVQRAHTGSRKSTLLALLMLTLLLTLAGSFLLQTKVAFAGTLLTANEATADSGDENGAPYSGKDMIDAQTNQADAYIPDMDTPLARAAQQGADGTLARTGSIFNTLIAVVSVISMLLMMLLLLIKKTTDYRVIVVRTLAVVFGLVIVTAWALLDKPEAPSRLFNGTSAIMAVLFVLYLLVVAASYWYEHRIKVRAHEGSFRAH